MAVGSTSDPKIETPYLPLLVSTTMRMSISSRVEENMNTKLKSHCLSSCANIDNLPRNINT